MQISRRGKGRDLEPITHTGRQHLWVGRFQGLAQGCYGLSGAVTTILGQLVPHEWFGKSSSVGLTQLSFGLPRWQNTKVHHR